MPSLSGMPNSRNIYNKTQPTVELMNRILDFILRNSDIRDMISLANPGECSKWIVIAEEQLKNFFDRVKIQPLIGKEQILYIKKIDDLKKMKDSSNELGCQTLAFFFVRLFQVVGALSLSIMDTKIPDRADYLKSKTEDPVYQQRGIPFFKKIDDKPKSWFGFGGELSATQLSSIPNELHMFSLYLTESANKGQYYLTTIATLRAKASNIAGFIIQIKGNRLVFTYSRGTSLNFELALKNGNQLNIEVLTRNNKEYPFNEDYSYAPQSNNTILVSIDTKSKDMDFADFIVSITNKIISLPPSQTMKTLKEFNYLESSRIKPRFLKIKDTNFGIENAGIFVSENDMLSESPKFLFGFATKINGKNVDVEVSFSLLIVKISSEAYSVEITNLVNETDSTKLNFKPNLNYEKLDKLSEGEEISESSAQNKFTIKSGFGAFSSEPTNGKTTIPKWLENKFNIIKKQALNIIEFGLEASKKGYQNPVDNSKVSDPKFKTSELWRNLLRDPPVKAFCSARALQLLDISGLKKATPTTIQPLIFNTTFDLVKDKSLPTPDSPIIDAHALKALVSLYEGADESTKKEESIGKIISAFIQSEYTGSKTIEELKKVKELTGNTSVPIADAKQINDLRNKAIELFNIQFEHTAKVNKLLNKLFTIDNSITLNNDILSKGILGIEEVALEARDLLSDYYSNCQIKYNEGVKIIQNPPPVVVKK